MGINLMADLGFDENAEDVKRARNAAHVYATVIDSLVSCRSNLGLTQKQVAERMGTTQSAVSDFESVNADARFSTVMRYAQAVDCDLVIELEPHPHGTETVDEKRAFWVDLKFVHSADLIPFGSQRYQHRPERLDGLAADEMVYEREAVSW